MRKTAPIYFAASLVMLIAGLAQSATREYVLTAAPLQWEVAPGQTVSALAYNGTVPGPVLRGSPGDTFRITLVNNLTQPTTIHWHGVAAPNGMDGVPGTTAPIVAPGQSFTYEFPAPTPGTYWYHPHVSEAAQMQDGLYGLLIVDPPAGQAPAWDQEVTLMIGELGAPEMISEPFNGTGMGMGGGMGGGMGSGTLMNGFVINGKTGSAIPDIHVLRNQRVLFRMVNTGNMVHPLHVQGMSWLVTATDGFDIPAPYRKDTLPINAGERYDGILTADNPGTWLVHCHDTMHMGNGTTGLVFRLVVE